MAARMPDYKLSVPKYERMVAAGLLTPEDRIELIRGVIVEKIPIGNAHANAVTALSEGFILAVGDSAVVRPQNPLKLSDSVPEPDLFLAAPPRARYRQGHPTPADVFLVVEVADSSLAADRDIKGPLYAENGIPEYWVVNLIDDTIEVHRDPQPAGTWGTTVTRRRGERVEVSALPGVGRDVGAVLG